MSKIIPNGTEVLIFENNENTSYNCLDETNFIKGIIISSKESDDLSHHGSPWYVQIYTIIGENGYTYNATYGSAVINNFYIRTVKDHIKHIKQVIKNNKDKINVLNEQNYDLINTINSLMQMELDNKVVTSTYAPNDSERIAELIDGLMYEPSKAKEILSRYDNILSKYDNLEEHRKL